ncbi:phosphoenolpyruvate--protein phosphotransferase [Nonomuraea cavernae]|uniref:Phosphoenolpyruvate-protein phosphotransferase n=1 Tax=Nonomuraea cavernae TaxID=2045107 RepID=A0A917YQX4_9ACTN|nr:phosphoenolpyruvate--protein phosphotransferase [Nonomuraea cavernae]MCA2184407.1 phosphoenolpyruvate--protein phosphotransferase [Nonomuraea cavernae]GGO63893.1 phosphoenolpyruvate-protein phosphotransferase [Nonomuraea cavernae]
MPDPDRPDRGTSVAGPGPRSLMGLGVSPGRSAGPLIRMAGPPALPAPRAVADPAAEVATIAKALEAVVTDLRRRAGETTDATAAEILDALAMMADDPMLREEAEQHVHDGHDAPHALDTAFTRHRETLAALGGYLAERAADLDDLRHRAVAAALGLPMPGVPSPGHPYVLVAEDLSPADTAGLGGEVRALVTSLGGPTSHTAILARGRGLPAVVACVGILDVPDGTVVSVDGGTGEIGLGLTPEAAAEVVDGDRLERERLAASGGPGRTADDHPVKLLLNIGSAADLRPNCEGVGLFRTEFLFLDRRQAPGFEEQVAAYAEVFAATGHVVVRTLDAGTDKPLPFLGLPAEPNPALGVRGLRVDRVLPAVLDTQLDAIAEAARVTGTAPWVMAPMVTTVAEAAGFAGRARSRGITRVGVMVEVPAAALQARELLAEVDFLSIGTNDLSQYTFAADRQHSGLADLLDPRQPALLRLIAMCAEAGRAAGKPVGVCGEAAGDPLLAPILVGLGVTSLSMAAVRVPAVRDELARHTLDECRRLAGG